MVSGEESSALLSASGCGLPDTQSVFPQEWLHARRVFAQSEDNEDNVSRRIL